MLFTTATFLCIFLPVVLAGFFLIGRLSHSAAAFWIFAASIFFYGYWMPQYTLLKLGSILGNFFLGSRIASLTDTGIDTAGGRPKLWLIAGVAINLLLLAYFKYANFFVDNLNAALGVEWKFARVVLPIGISFFTFTQIAYLVDTWQKGVREYKFTHYGLFVTYFPHLIAGPVLHHAQMMPQFGNASTYRFQSSNFTTGLGIFALGMVKKVVLADGISPYADAVFKPADMGLSPSFQEAWLGAIAYTLQLYFDFSGYSDMAIGLSLMMNVRLPFNFNSPYAATNISDFWRRWHMSLSQFLRDYLYIALGGNRVGGMRRYLNLMTTMVLGGLWHGASWSFVIWGFLHGMYLGLNHGFRALCGPRLMKSLDESKTFACLAWALTILSVVVAWVLFRAETLAGAGRMLRSMGTPNLSMDIQPLLWNAGLGLQTGTLWCATLAAVAVLGPNSNHIGQKLLAVCREHLTMRALIGGISLALVVFTLVINVMRDSVSAFIYFNF